MDSAELIWVVKKLAELEANHRTVAKYAHGVRPYRAAENVAAEWQKEPDVPPAVQAVLQEMTK
jgi:hypothetical protein